MTACRRATPAVMAACLCLLPVAARTAAALACAAAAADAFAQTAVRATPGPVAASAGEPMRYRPNRFAGRAGQYYKQVWGVDSLSVKWVESGEIVRFSWRVLDPDKAQALSDKVAVPSLRDPQAGVELVVPSLEQIGQLRQTPPPEFGKVYWMAFSNKGRNVKRGDRVDVVIGPFHAEGLEVD